MSPNRSVSFFAAEQHQFFLLRVVAEEVELDDAVLTIGIAGGKASKAVGRKAVNVKGGAFHIAQFYLDFFKGFARVLVDHASGDDVGAHVGQTAHDEQPNEHADAHCPTKRSQWF